MPDLTPSQRQELATRFAPHWRYNARMDKSRTRQRDSRQNFDEYYFPMSVDRFFAVAAGEEAIPVQKLGRNRSTARPKALHVRRPVERRITSRGHLHIRYAKDLVQDPSELGDYVVGTDEMDELVGLGFGERYLADHVRLAGYPKYMIGEIATAATYYKVFAPDSAAGDDLGDDACAISYYLYYPYDTAGKFGFIRREFGAHRADWENVTVVVSDASTAPRIHSVVYYGHHLRPKRVYRGEEFLRLTDETHTQVFVSWGTHACYPVPGVIYDMNVRFLGLRVPTPYDEFFNGENSQELESWKQELVDLDDPDLAPWAAFVGMWGPDGSASQGSALSPRYKKRWDRLAQGSQWARRLKQPQDWSRTTERYRRSGRYDEL